MKIVFSRKGFDSGSGGLPSPIVDGVPISLPIPKSTQEPFCYQDIVHPTAGNIGEIVESVTKGRISREDTAHYDPQLPWETGKASLGQDGAAQSHLINQGVSAGDLLVFFGLFRDYTAPKSDPNSWAHHRIFGYMEIERMVPIGPHGAPGMWREMGLPRPHPHTERTDMHAINAIWVGTGQLAKSAHPELRLSAEGSSPSIWQVPSWLKEHGLSYHGNPDRWTEGRLKLVARGQEFVSDTSANPHQAQEWADSIRSLVDLEA